MEPQLVGKGRKQSAKAETHLQRHLHTAKVPPSLLVMSERAPRCLPDLRISLHFQGCFTVGRVVSRVLWQSCDATSPRERPWEQESLTAARCPTSR